MTRFYLPVVAACEALPVTVFHHARRHLLAAVGEREGARLICLITACVACERAVLNENTLLNSRVLVLLLRITAVVLAPHCAAVPVVWGE